MFLYFSVLSINLFNVNEFVFKLVVIVLDFIITVVSFACCTC